MSEKQNIVKNTSEHAKQRRVRKFFARQKDEALTLNFWKALLSELLGTLFLCAWTIGSGLHKKGDSVEVLDLALGAGFIVGLLILALQNASGANINPAFSISFLVAGHISAVRFIFYVIVQTIAGIIAVYLNEVLFPEDMWGNLGLISPGKGVNDWQAFGCEFCITFLLAFVAFATIDKERSDVKGQPAFFIGLTVGVNVLLAAHVSGGCMNPARNFGPALVTGKELEKQWIYWCGPMLGGMAGTLLYEKLLSVRALSTTCTGGCFGARDKSVGVAVEAEAEAEVMLDEHTEGTKEEF